MILSKLTELRNLHTSKVIENLNIVILYFHPITDIRVGGTKRKSINLLKEFATLFEAESITIVTTMWNMCHTPKQLADANARLESLKSSIYQSSEELYMQVTKLEYESHWSPWSAPLDVIDRSNMSYRLQHADLNAHSKPQNHKFALNNLIERIENIQQRLQFLSDDFQYVTSDAESQSAFKTGRILNAIKREEEEATRDLKAFSYDLYELDLEAYSALFPDSSPPSPPPPPTTDRTMVAMLFSSRLIRWMKDL
ncbi:hypothetical protein CVT24_006554 [Panaeolus cyanescens]|uniref:Uncharacterized protein n=1 Tax=Panaeolus cyanescens TaxID=181874 RepID=A0A409WBY1_9AGAR|nr:hypothetical protein CVT24_006554 [Panaeolus cyanescens]